MSKAIHDLQQKILLWGSDIDEREIDLRNILFEIVNLLDQALPEEIESDDANPS